MECLICLGTTRTFWTPPTPCPCKPNLHKTCWDTWISQTTEPICIICRNQPRHPVLRPIVYIVQQPTWALFIGRIASYIISAYLFFFFIYIAKSLKVNESTVRDEL